MKFKDDDQMKTIRELIGRGHREWYADFPPSRIRDRLFVGNIYNAADLAYANPFGITAVLNVSTEPPYDQNPKIVYRDIPFPDGYEIPARAFSECMAFLRFCWENNHVIMIHCAAGISRSASIAMSFMYYMGMNGTLDDAATLVKLCRPIVNPAPAIIKSCKQLLRVFPYDGSYGDTAPEGALEATILDALKASDTWHTNPECPMLQLALANTPRHLVQCTCGRTKEDSGQRGNIED